MAKVTIVVLNQKSFLSLLLVTKKLNIKKVIDRYKRIVAGCLVNNFNLNKELVKNGWALAYREYSKY